MAEARNKLVCGADSIFKDPSKAAAFAASLKSARFSDEAIQKLPNLEKYRGQRVSIAAVVIREAGEDSELKADQVKRRFVCDWIMSQLGYGGGI